MCKDKISCCDNCEDGILEGICLTCYGSGEGMTDGSTCFACKGSGNEMNYCDCERGDQRLSMEIF